MEFKFLKKDCIEYFVFLTEMFDQKYKYMLHIIKTEYGSIKTEWELLFNNKLPFKNLKKCFKKLIDLDFNDADKKRDWNPLLQWMKDHKRNLDEQAEIYYNRKLQK